MPGSPIICPHCDTNDRVEKVSAVIARYAMQVQSTDVKQCAYHAPSGGQHTVESIVPTSYHIGETSGPPNIATSLVLPQPMDWMKGSGGVLLGVLITFVGGFAGLVMSVTIFDVDNGWMFAPVIPALLLGIVAGIWRERHKQMAVNALMPKWERAYQRWDRLYYCNLHDVVIDPDTGVELRPEETRAYCYDETLLGSVVPAVSSTITKRE